MTLVVSNALARLCIPCVVPKISVVKFAVKLGSRRKRVVFGSQFLREGISSISDMHFQIALTSEHVVGFG